MQLDKAHFLMPLGTGELPFRDSLPVSRIPFEPQVRHLGRLPAHLGNPIKNTDPDERYWYNYRSTGQLVCFQDNGQDAIYSHLIMSDIVFYITRNYPRH